MPGGQPYLLSVTTKHGVHQFDAVGQAGRDNIAGPERGAVIRDMQLCFHFND